ncbi:MAG: dihydrolipoyl dehydrogenase [Bacteroidota bacterium]
MKFDLIVVGSGPGGYVAAIRASQLGLKTAIVEKENLGGVCLNWGCIPTKALLKSAQVFEYINHAADYGLEVSGAKHNFDKVIKRSRDVAGGMSKGVNFLMKKNDITVIEGHGRLARGKKVEVEKADGSKEEISAPHIIVATGGRSRALPHIPIDNEVVIGYRKAMTLDKQPKRMVVIGAGAIGVEFAYFYSTMGTEVTVVEFMEQGLLPREDKDISKELGKIFKKKGVQIMANASVESVERDGDVVMVSVKNRKDNSIKKIECDIVLSATGVAPNVEDVGLDVLGIKTEKGLIQVDDYYQTNVQGIYAIGDVTKGAALAHVASAEGIICVEHIAGHHPKPLDYGNIPSCTYCVPEVASVGMTEEQAKDAGYEIRLGKFPFSASGKAKAGGNPEGFVKVIYDAKYGELLGAHLIGSNVTEMIAEIVAARNLETTGMEIVKSVHPHPTMSEAVMEASAAAYDEVIHL